MADARRFALGNQLDIEQILLEAQHRWLRPAEICEILRNYKNFQIAPEPPNLPGSGALFLFDRKVLRYFRKDGHNWRKKKDGKTVKEAHERLKAGSIDVLHCYYAHGEDNENFQRRSYWMLEEELSHIVLVHYREVKGNRTNYNRSRVTEASTSYSQDTGETLPNSEVEGSQSSSFHPHNYQVPSQTTDTVSMNSVHTSEYEDVESGYSNQASSRVPSVLDPQHPLLEKNAGFSDPYYAAAFTNNYRGKLPPGPGIDKSKDDSGYAYDPRKQPDFLSWEDPLENSATGVQPLPLNPSSTSRLSESMGSIPKNDQEILRQFFTNNFADRQDFGSLMQWPLDQKLNSDTEHNVSSRLREQDINHPDLRDLLEPSHAYPDKQNGLPLQLSNLEQGHEMKQETESYSTKDGKPFYSSAIKSHLLQGPLIDEGLKKNDSFTRWMSKALDDVKEFQMQSNSETYWDTVEGENGIDVSSIPPQAQLDSYLLGPSISQDQLFSIIDFSPNWAYEHSEIKVLITGRFLIPLQEVESWKWSCMFGEVEVPAEIIADGVLRCHTPALKVGRVPFYITCSNRLACSEVREFEFRVNQVPDVDITDIHDDITNENLQMRFGKLLSLSSNAIPHEMSGEISQLSNKISPLLNKDDDDWEQMLILSSEDPRKVKENLLQKLLKEKLHVWLLHKVAEGGKGPSVLDKGGQGVLHFAAALGYDWALEPTVIAGVSIDFRDVKGWTALHWAAYCGRERTVASLISLGAAPGALSDPTPKYPSGRTPADLAYSIGHKGTAGYLAASDLNKHLEALSLDKKSGDATETGARTIQTVSPRNTSSISDGDSLKDSLTAVRNATQAAARIHQVFRVQSFQKKQMKEFDGEKFRMSDERALSFLAVKSHKQGHQDEPVHTAAIRIQNKFRSYKGRKDFLIMRQQVVKIQAHVRGHQVRKNYKKIVWSVGIVEKIILRWRRKGSGLRGFKSEALTESSSMQVASPKDDDYDFLKEGRKQKEERLQKALNRVKSMVQYPEARDQYRRLLNVVTEIQETKTVALNNAGTAEFDDDLFDIEALLDDDTYMSTAS